MLLLCESVIYCDVAPKVKLTRRSLHQQIVSLSKRLIVSGFHVILTLLLFIISFFLLFLSEYSADNPIEASLISHLCWLENNRISTKPISDIFCLNSWTVLIRFNDIHSFIIKVWDGFFNNETNLSSPTKTDNRTV